MADRNIFAQRILTLQSTTIHLEVTDPLQATLNGVPIATTDSAPAIVTGTFNVTLGITGGSVSQTWKYRKQGNEVYIFVDNAPLLAPTLPAGSISISGIPVAFQGLRACSFPIVYLDDPDYMRPGLLVIQPSTSPGAGFIRPYNEGDFPVSLRRIGPFSLAYTLDTV